MFMTQITIIITKIQIFESYLREPDNTMSYSKTHIYNVRFSVKSLQANCQRSSCKVHIAIKIQNEQRKLKQIAEMKKNTAIFNSQLLWEHVPIKFDQMSATYFETAAIISIQYQTSQQNSRINKLKIGQVIVNLGKLLNSKTYKINNLYNVEKCYDPNAKLKLAIDLTRIQDTEINYNRQIKQKSRQYYKSAITGPTQGNMFKVSKIRQKMNEQQKNMLQNKLEEYEDKLQKYRDQHNEQIKRLTEQMDKKQQRISILLSQNNTLTQAVQNLQVQIQKYKTRVGNLEKDNLQYQQNLRKANIQKNSLFKQLSSMKQQLESTSIKLEQTEQMKDKKEVHYKQQLQKYTQKYMESENNRNKIVFELQNKLKAQLKKKDEYFNQLISKLENKMQVTGHSSKQTIVKKQKQMLILIQRNDKIDRQKNNLLQQLRQVQEQKQQLLNIKISLEQQISNLTAKLKNVQSEYQMCTFSNINNERQLQKIKSQCKAHTKTMQQIKFENDLANKTIQEQQSTIVKLHRQLKTHKEREYYMQEKFQDELQIKTYNEQCVRGTNNYYKGQIKKLQIKIKFLEQKIEDGETSITTAGRQKQKLQQQIKNNNKIIFQSSHQLLRLQNDHKKLQQKCEQLQFELNSKQLYNKQLQEKLNLLLNERQNQIQEYVMNINSLQNQIKEINLRRSQELNQWEIQFENQNAQKNGLLSELGSQVERLRQNQVNLKDKLTYKDQRELQLQRELRAEKDRIKQLERQSLKTKFQITKLTDQTNNYAKEEPKLKKQIIDLKNQINNNKMELQKYSKKIERQRQAYIELIKWILDRNWDNVTSKQFIQQTSSQIQINFVSFINENLQKIYSYWEKNIKKISQLLQENEKYSDQLAKIKLQQQYQSQYGKHSKMDIDFNSLHPNLDIQLLQTKNITTNKPMLTDLSVSYDIKQEQAKTFNYQYQKQLQSKNAQIQALNEALFEERTKARDQSSEIRALKQQLEDLNVLITKKTVIINNLQSQINQRDMSGSMSSLTYFSQKSPARATDYKAQAQIKFKQQKLITQLQCKLEQIQRQNALQKSKIDLLQGKLKISNQKAIADNQKINTLQKGLKDKQQNLKRISKQFEQSESYLTKIKKQLQIALSKISKKDTYIEQLKNQLQKKRKIVQSLTTQAQQWSEKYTKREKQLQRQAAITQKCLLQTAQSLATEKIEKQKANLEQTSLIVSLRNNVKQAERRINSLQNLLKKLKQQNQEIQQKNLKLMESLNQSEQKIKDIVMNENLIKSANEKSIADLQEMLQQKQFEFEEFKFSLQSRIMQLEKQLQQKSK